MSTNLPEALESLEVGKTAEIAFVNVGYNAGPSNIEYHLRVLGIQELEKVLEDDDYETLLGRPLIKIVLARPMALSPNPVTALRTADEEDGWRTFQIVKTARAELAELVGKSFSIPCTPEAKLIAEMRDAPPGTQIF